MRSTAGGRHDVSGPGRNEVNIEMITTSDISISCIIEQGLAEKAVKALHTVFTLEE